MNPYIPKLTALGFTGYFYNIKMHWAWRRKRVALGHATDREGDLVTNAIHPDDEVMAHLLGMVAVQKDGQSLRVSAAPTATDGEVRSAVDRIVSDPPQIGYYPIRRRARAR